MEGALEAQRGGSKRVGELLVELKLAAKGDVGEAFEEISWIPYAGELRQAIPEEVIRKVPAEVAYQCCAIPLRYDNRKLVVAMAEPQNLRHSDELRFTTGLQIEPQFAFRDDLERAITRHYGKQEKVDIEPEESEPRPMPETSLESKAEGMERRDEVEFLTLSSRETRREAQKEFMAGLKQRTPAVRLVSEILAAAAEKKASDIHIEPQASATKVRFRVDGILRDSSMIPSHQEAAVVSRIKILADMDISERRLPQDGRILVKIHENRLDLRISTLPTAYGEKVVIRLLEPDSPLATFQEMGMGEEIEKGLLKLLRLPQGMLLVVGPTGSGKSTTLYGALTQLRSSTRNIVTVEDPVEYMLEGINQAQVNVKAGLTFATCLRSIMRQDPDVIMVGEIRDRKQQRLH